MKKIIIALLIVTLAALSLYLGSTYYYYSPLYPTTHSAIAIITPTKGNNAAGIVHFVQQRGHLYYRNHSWSYSWKPRISYS